MQTVLLIFSRTTFSWPENPEENLNGGKWRKICKHHHKFATMSNLRGNRQKLPRSSFYHCRRLLTILGATETHKRTILPFVLNRRDFHRDFPPNFQTFYKRKLLFFTKLSQTLSGIISSDQIWQYPQNFAFLHKNSFGMFRNKFFIIRIKSFQYKIIELNH